MTDLSISVPENVTFEQGIEITELLLNTLEENSLLEAEITRVITELVKTHNGARGFFVTYLTDARPGFDQPMTPILQALETSPEIVSDLLVKNVAMSAAMVVYHHRHNNLEMQESSQQVVQRSSNLIQQLNFSLLRSRLQQLFNSVQTGAGSYQDFLERWKYDSEQLAAIVKILERLL
ncbi:hypothetical protein [Planktothrix agardhii]|jgi:hypothetical protein|uniref:Uncharacterized protein n=2 Tax=Planktothrix agardhii TaxID=1160 RepID=A0A073CQ18_PLAA1|nr:hypothetical protein [Planktothrix agardhii]MCF3607918.1 hypothetical protein [Planktothrix agardhii 1033]BBD55066.1 hypothetical protein NIES204_23660 [Planktothrix agardhii NIES-204]KEI66130.1 hypothetical protein A19Y_1007 [Planktothrix agardhii NIVA-CYA 126/8]MBG0745314.1 hypothetical protein [Planktothrix agardhii KL2]MCB8752014.1 hypothetical protein [Planktothrix agardhii 1810]